MLAYSGLNESNPTVNHEESARSVGQICFGRTSCKVDATVPVFTSIRVIDQIDFDSNSIAL